MKTKCFLAHKVLVSRSAGISTGGNVANNCSLLETHNICLVCPKTNCH